MLLLDILRGKDVVGEAAHHHHLDVFNYEIVDLGLINSQKE